ncbi:hypothetical protein EXS71_00790 [Candidatus Uhrbacteria bacterium]|nr:hypothetical protein [Candidatus Uhrbacteria bacterium]
MPLAWLLLVWLVLIAILFIMSFLTLLVYLRFGLFGLSTYGSTLLFLIVSAIMLGFIIQYLINVDWSQTVNPLSPFMAFFEV